MEFNTKNKFKLYIFVLSIILLAIFILISLQSVYFFLNDLSRGGNLYTAFNLINIVYEDVSGHFILGFLFSLPITLVLIKYLNSNKLNSKHKTSLKGGLYSAIISIIYLFIIFDPEVPYPGDYFFLVYTIPFVLFASFISGAIIFRMTVFFQEKQRLYKWALILTLILILINIPVYLYSTELKSKSNTYFFPQGSIDEMLEHCNQNIGVSKENKDYCIYVAYSQQALDDPENVVEWCSKIQSGPRSIDECIFNSAYKNQIPDLCQSINDLTLKENCLTG
jgi:hypothetical protein|tara:strand:- start:678 stop:1514 length:837 start_codon:yes stop_codon:yes gene_type:complete